MTYVKDDLVMDRPWLAAVARQVLLDPMSMTVTAEDEHKRHWTDAKYCTDEKGDHLDSPAGWDIDL